jgi:hypothetical protein
MRRLALTCVAAAALFVGSASVAESKVPGFGTEDSCASVFTEDAAACGGTVYLVYRLVYYPYKTAYSMGQAWCETRWSNGVVTNGPC